jgi:hypothetical protein
MKVLRLIQLLLDNFWAPGEALFFDPDKEPKKNDYQPEKRHVTFWFYVSGIVGIGSWIFHWAAGLIALPLIALLLCRLALSERRIAELITTSKTS